MSLDPAIEAQMGATVQLHTCTVDSGGEKTYAAAVNVGAYISPFSSRSTVVYKDAPPRYSILLKPVADDGSAVTVKASDKLTLPSLYPDPREVPVKEAHPLISPDSTLSHWEVTA